MHPRLRHELKTFALTAIYFAIWFGILVLLKHLVLEEYHIEFRGLSLALIGALVAAKVVLVLEMVPMARWVRMLPPVYDVIVRTIIYTAGVLAVLFVEKAFELRSVHGGVGGALVWLFGEREREFYHVWANTIVVALALLGFNAFSVLRRYLGGGELARLYFSTPAPGHR